ncbi:MAG: hypothetical protein ACRD3K_12340 [Edaphobacter sp.]
MMSTAILMAASLEHAGARPVSAEMLPDPGELKEISFAKSFRERVGGTDTVPEKSPVEEAAVALPDLKGASFAKILDEAAAIPVSAKAKLSASQQIPEHSELKRLATEKTIQPQVPTKAGLEKQAEANAPTVDSGATEVDSSEQTEDVAGDVSFDTPSAQSTFSAAGEAVEANVIDEARPPIANNVVDLPKGEIANAEQKKDSAPLKKVATTQASGARSKSVQKTAETVSDSPFAEAKPVMGSSMVGVIPTSVQMVTAVVTPAVVVTPDGVSRAAANNKGASGVTNKPLAGVAPVTAERAVHKAVIDGEKVDATGIEATAPAQLVVPSKTGAEPEKVAVAAIPEGKDSDSKAQSSSTSTVSMVHTVTAGVAPSVVVPGSVPGESIAATLPVGDASAHGMGLMAGSKEEGLGATASPDGMPRMLTATPTMLEVGIQNGTHGWLKVRAEMADGGAVNASVSAASSSGQEMLHRELPALTAYLQDEKVAVSTVVVHTSPIVGADARTSTGMGGAGGQTSQRNDGAGDRHQKMVKTAHGVDEGIMQRRLRGVEEDGSLPLAAYVVGGAWLSVRA